MLARKGLGVMVWHCCWVCERVKEHSRIQQVKDDVSNHLNVGENIVLFLFTEIRNSIDTQIQKINK